MESVAVKGTKRSEIGKKATKAVRAEGLVPCVIYGGDEVVHFSATSRAFRDLVYTPDFKLAEVEVDGKTYKCILKDLQFHPVSDDLLHLDLLQLVDGKMVKAQIPVGFRGDAPGVKLGGKLSPQLRRIKVKTTPDKLVEKLYVDVSGLDLGQSVRVKDVEVAEGIEVMSALGTPVASIEIPRALRSATAAAATDEEGGDEQ